MLGRSVVHCLTDRGHAVRIRTRGIEKTQNMFGGSVHIVEGTMLNRDDALKAVAGPARWEADAQLIPG